VVRRIFVPNSHSKRKFLDKAIDCFDKALIIFVKQRQNSNDALHMSAPHNSPDASTQQALGPAPSSSRLSRQTMDAQSAEILLKSTLEQQYQQRMTIIQGEVGGLREAVRASMNQGPSADELRLRADEARWKADTLRFASEEARFQAEERRFKAEDARSKAEERHLQVLYFINWLYILVYDHTVFNRYLYLGRDCSSIQGFAALTSIFEQT
jgi:hypothetical protein